MIALKSSYCWFTKNEFRHYSPKVLAASCLKKVWCFIGLSSLNKLRKLEILSFGPVSMMTIENLSQVTALQCLKSFRIESTLLTSPDGMQCIYKAFPNLKELDVCGSRLDWTTIKFGTRFWFFYRFWFCFLDIGILEKSWKTTQKGLQKFPSYVVSMMNAFEYASALLLRKILSVKVEHSMIFAERSWMICAERHRTTLFMHIYRFFCLHAVPWMRLTSPFGLPC